MLTLEEAIKPILEEEAVDGYGPVCAYEGKYHWFVYFGFDGKMTPGDTPYAINKETGEVDFSQLRISFGMKSRPQLSWKWERLKRFPSPRQQQAPPWRGLFMPLITTFTSLKKAGRCVQCQQCHAPKKERGGAFNANNAKP